MDLELAGRAFVFGFVIAAPVGPIGMLCIQRGLQRGFLPALSGGVGTAAADAVYATLAAAGMTALTHMLAPFLTFLKLGGCAFLIWMGIQAIRLPVPVHGDADFRPGDAFEMLLVTFGLTLANPATILSFVALFGNLGLAPAAPVSAIATAVGGVFLGSLTWWIVLSAVVAGLRERIPLEAFSWINRAAGVALIGLALMMVT